MSGWDNRPTTITTWPWKCRHCGQERPEHGPRGECPPTARNTPNDLLAAVFAWADAERAWRGWEGDRAIEYGLAKRLDEAEAALRTLAERLR